MKNILRYFYRYFFVLYFSFIRLDSFYDQRIEVMLSESIHGFSTKDIYIKQKDMFIISYIYQKAIVKKTCSYSYQKILLVIELQVSQKVMFIIFLVFEDIYQNLLCSFNFTFIRHLFIYLFNLFIDFIYLFIYFIYHFTYLINYVAYVKEQKVRLKEKVEERLEENMIKLVKLLKRSVTYKFI